jgi:tRNA(fMet)-specific endonuclease VapC
MAPFEEQAARSYGTISTDYGDHDRDALDKLNASHSIVLGFTLVTNNQADCLNYPVLVVENWVNSF